MSTKRIIILGGGFGGVKCAETLRDLQNGAAVREDSLLEGDHLGVSVQKRFFDCRWRNRNVAGHERTMQRAGESAFFSLRLI